MAGIYIHIPFCLTRCHYCDFYSETRLEMVESFHQSCLKEIGIKHQYLEGEPADSIYFGGGTPSLVDPAMLDELLRAIQDQFNMTPDPEITLEVNPDDVSDEKLTQWLKSGFNRISMGLQSFRSEDLELMNRRHQADQALDVPRMAFDAGFVNISLDLIYGIPGLSRAAWKNNLELLADLPFTHLSAYHLTIEPGTVFDHWKKTGKLTEMEDQDSLEQYELLCTELKKMGVEQYEISNFARNQKYSRHNMKYWTGESYVGLGPSAHSYNGRQRHWNPASVRKYQQYYLHGDGQIGEETLTPAMSRNELIMTRLRTVWGITKNDWEQQVSTQSWTDFIQQCQPMIHARRLGYDRERLVIPQKRFFEADGIIAELFTV